MSGRGRNGRWHRRAAGEDVGERELRSSPPPSSTRSKPPTPLISKEEGRGRKIGSLLVFSNQHFCALSSFRLFSQITCIFFFLLSLLSLSPLCHPLLSPFTAGLGYSFRCQAHSVSLLLRVTERQRERGERESEKRRGRGGGRKRNWKKYEKRQATATQRKRKEGGK